MPDHRPPVVLTGEADHAVLGRRSLERAGWRLEKGFQAAPPDSRGSPGVVRWGTVTDPHAGAEAVLAVARGSGAVILVPGDRQLRARLFEDLSRLGCVEVPEDTSRALTPDELRMLALLADGCSVAEVASHMNWSERTVRRRLKSARERLGVSTTVEAILRVGDLAPPGT